MTSPDINKRSAASSPAYWIRELEGEIIKGAS